MIALKGRHHLDIELASELPGEESLDLELQPLWQLWHLRRSAREDDASEELLLEPAHAVARLVGGGGLDGSEHGVLDAAATDARRRRREEQLGGQEALPPEPDLLVVDGRAENWRVVAREQLRERKWRMAQVLLERGRPRLARHFLEVARGGDMGERAVGRRFDAEAVEDGRVELRERRAADAHGAHGAAHDVAAHDGHNEGEREADVDDDARGALVREEAERGRVDDAEPVQLIRLQDALLRLEAPRLELARVLVRGQPEGLGDDQRHLSKLRPLEPQPAEDVRVQRLLRRLGARFADLDLGGRAVGHAVLGIAAARVDANRARHRLLGAAVDGAPARLGRRHRRALRVMARARCLATLRLGTGKRTCARMAESAEPLCEVQMSTMAFFHTE
mmetsp:Transcript_12232/g.26423  ORF Transcript_12232/g.26423 Transcript_12232/m.26423 type:complete len:393 (+) Transcript_12232:946-2124(+)